MIRRRRESQITGSIWAFTWAASVTLHASNWAEPTLDIFVPFQVKWHIVRWMLIILAASKVWKISFKPQNKWLFQIMNFQFLARTSQDGLIYAKRKFTYSCSLKPSYEIRFLPCDTVHWSWIRVRELDFPLPSSKLEQEKAWGNVTSREAFNVWKTAHFWVIRHGSEVTFESIIELPKNS